LHLFFHNAELAVQALVGQTRRHSNTRDPSGWINWPWTARSGRRRRLLHPVIGSVTIHTIALSNHVFAIER
jgi:hypothetical protein